VSEIRLLRAADYQLMPWKNGAGSTEEIARDNGAGLDGFGWRLSIADIGESGAFSSFPGYQRIISVLEGAGMQLQVESRQTRPLLPFEAFAFRGESAVSCTLLDGPIRDLNLIYAPQRYSARLQWLDCPEPQRLFSSAETVLLFSADEQVQVNPGQGDERLGRHDCLQVETNRQLLEIQLLGRCCLIELSAR
jgi:environmental stress-induced protein Ves